MGKHEKLDLPLYDKDFAAWTKDQAAKLRKRAHNEIDWENVAEEIESLGRSQRHEIENRFAVLIHHLLKWQFQPGRRSESWRISVGEQRTWIPGIIKHSPSLKAFPKKVFADAYVEGRRRAINETGLSPKVFPAEPPFSVADALSDKFWPGDPFQLHGILRD
jgi:predicted YcjX-like family ATPase